MKDTKKSESKKRAYKISLKRAKVTGIVCLFVVCISLLAISPLFNIKTIYVRGNNHVSSELVLATSGIKKGDNIFTVNSSKSCRAIEGLSRVDSCRLERSLPGKLEIIIDEKSETAYIKTKTGYAGIDSQGKVLVLTKTVELQSPVISGITIAEPKVGEFIKCEEKNAKSKMEDLTLLLNELEQRSLIKDVKSVNIKDIKNVSITLNTKTVVNFGENGKENEDSFEYKIAFLKAILEKDYPKQGGIIELADTSNVTSRVS